MARIVRDTQKINADRAKKELEAASPAALPEAQLQAQQAEVDSMVSAPPITPKKPRAPRATSAPVKAPPPAPAQEDAPGTGETPVPVETPETQDATTPETPAPGADSPPIETPDTGL